jgi:hypothetical protein
MECGKLVAGRVENRNCKGCEGQTRLRKAILLIRLQRRLGCGFSLLGGQRD